MATAAAYVILVARSSAKLQHDKPDSQSNATLAGNCINTLQLINKPKLRYKVVVLTCCRAFIGAERAILPEANDAAAVPLVAWSAQPQVCSHLLAAKTSPAVLPPTTWGQHGIQINPT